MTEAASQGKTNNILICIEDILNVLQLESFTLEKALIYLERMLLLQIRNETWGNKVNAFKIIQDQHFLSY